MKTNYDKQFTLACNALESHYSMARAQWAHNIGMGGGTKICKLWSEAGYPETISPIDLYQKYTRDGIAYGIIKKLMDLVFENDPKIVEGDPGKESQTEQTPTEKEIKQWANKINLWSSFKQGDTARSVCEYAGIIIYVKDDKQLKEPLDSITNLDQIEGFKIAWQQELTVSARENNRNSINFQKPVMFDYLEYKPDGVQNQNTNVSEQPQIHASRVFMLGDVYGIGANAGGNRVLVPVFNNLVGLGQIDAAATSGTVKAAAQHMTWNYESTSAISDIAKQYGVSTDKLSGIFQDMVDRVNNSLDSALITSGADISTLDVNMPNLDEARKGHQDAIGAGSGIAWTQLTGIESGERSSTENSAATRKTAKSRQKEVETNDINRFFQWLQSYGLWQGKDLQCDWPDLLESTLAEKLANVSLMADANQKMLGELVFSAKEMREVADYDPEIKMTPAEKVIADKGESFDDLPGDK